MISYAQNFEDVILERYFKGKNKGFYVDVGAASPTFHSVTKHFYDKGWRGINIEPSLTLFKGLMNDRERDINLNIVVANQDGLIKFFDLENSGLSSIIELNANTAYSNENQRDYDGNKIENIKSVLIEAAKLSSILSKYALNIEIDFLKIDVEGAEKEVIKSNNWVLFRPKVLIVEATLPNSKIQNHSEWEEILINVEYTFVYFDGLNRIYLRNDLLEHKDIFSYPTCLFDEFTKYSEVEKQVKIDELQKQNQQLLLEQQQHQIKYQQLQKQNQQLLLEQQQHQIKYQQLQKQNQQLLLEQQQHQIKYQQLQKQNQQLLLEQQQHQIKYQQLQRQNQQLLLEQQQHQIKYQQLQSILDSIIMSPSWQITSPLRFMKKRVKAFLKFINNIYCY